MAQRTRLFENLIILQQARITQLLRTFGQSTQRQSLLPSALLFCVRSSIDDSGHKVGPVRVVNLRLRLILCSHSWRQRNATWCWARKETKHCVGTNRSLPTERSQLVRRSFSQAAGRRDDANRVRFDPRRLMLMSLEIQTM